MKLIPSPTDLDHLHWLEAAGIRSFAKTSLLELGCGSGFICEKATADQSPNVVGMDILKPKYFAEDSKWKFTQANFDDPNWNRILSPESFDLILGFDIIEHLSSPFDFLQNCNKLMTKKGHLVLTTPNVMSWERLSRPNGWSGAMDPQHKTLFSRYSLEFMLSRSGFQTRKIIAPIRKLGTFASFLPQAGGQIFCLASKL